MSYFLMAAYLSRYLVDNRPLCRENSGRPISRRALAPGFFCE